MSFVQGSYNTVDEALEAAKRLQNEGYSSKDITLISNVTTRDSYLNNSDINVKTPENYDEDNGLKDESLWDKIVNAFTVEDEYDRYPRGGHEDPLVNYRSDIDAGKVLLVVEDDRNNVQDASYTSDGVQDGAYTRDGVVDDPAYNNRNENYEDNRTIELSEEKLDVSTNEVQTGEVNVSKNVVEERESVDVPVEHEEVVIERHAVDGEREANHHDFKNEEFSIPVNEEQINVDKKSVVTEEVSIGKERVTEDKHVEETVRREELDIENTGDVDVNNSRNREDGYVEEDSLGNKDRYVEEDTLVDKDRLDKNDRF